MAADADTSRTGLAGEHEPELKRIHAKTRSTGEFRASFYAIHGGGELHALAEAVSTVWLRKEPRVLSQSCLARFH